MVINTVPKPTMDCNPINIYAEIIPLVNNDQGLPGSDVLRLLPPIEYYQAMFGGNLVSQPAETANEALHNVKKSHKYIMCTTLAIPKNEESTHGYILRWDPLDKGKMCILSLQQLHTITAQKIVVTTMLSMIQYGFPIDLVKMIGRLIYNIPNLADHAVLLVCFSMPTNAVDVQILVEMANHFLSL